MSPKGNAAETQNAQDDEDRYARNTEMQVRIATQRSIQDGMEKSRRLNPMEQHWDEGWEVEEDYVWTRCPPQSPEQTDGRR